MSAKMTVATTVHNQYAPAAGSKPKYTKIEELKKKYESYAKAAAQVPMGVCKKSKVKQIVSMFDAQITQNADAEKCNNSTEAKQQINLPPTNSLDMVKSNFDKELAPIPKPRTKLAATYDAALSSFNEEQAPIARNNLSTTSDAAKTNFNGEQEAPVPRSRTSLSTTHNSAISNFNGEQAPVPIPRTSLSTTHNSAISNFNGEQAPVPIPRLSLSTTHNSAISNFNGEQAPIPIPRTNLSTTHNSAISNFNGEHQAPIPKPRHSPSTPDDSVKSSLNGPQPSTLAARTNQSTTHDLVKSSFNGERANITKSWTKQKLRATCNSNTFFVSEDEFAKLTVKHKVQLYSQFINEMSNNKPKFVEQAALMAARAEKTEVRGEVVNEKQASVKYLLAKLEASCGLPRQKVADLTLQSPATVTKAVAEINVKAKLRRNKAKEFEDLLQKPASHTSTLTIKLQEPCEIAVYQQRSKSLTRYETKHKDDFKAPGVLEPAQKRNNEQMRYCLPFEVYAPPKKIRRTQAERLQPKIFFQSQKLKDLFFMWLTEREQQQCKERGQPEEIIWNSKEAKPKQENRDNGANKKEPKPRERKNQLTLRIPAAVNQVGDSQKSSKTAGPCRANDESESGLSLLQKITSDESQADNPAVKSDNGDEFVESVKPARKKKLRRTLTWPKSKAAEETNPTTNSTDSDTEIKLLATRAKMLFLETPALQQSNEKDVPSQPSSEELDSDLLRDVNSPRKIKSAYTLTAYTPSPTQEDEEEDKELYPNAAGYSSSSSQEEKNKFTHVQPETSELWSTAIDNSASGQRENFESTSQKSRSLNRVSFSDVTNMAANMCDSFIDQGFETGSNMDMDSPVRAAKSFTFKQQIQATDDRDSSITSNKKDFGNCAPPPASITMPWQTRRRSINEHESRPSSLTMQAIREDQPLDQSKIPPRSSSTAYAPTSPDLPGLPLEQTSQFWIKCDYFCLSFDIFYNDANRVRMLFNIFSQKSYDTRDLCFGIDKFIFSVYGKGNISKRLPPKNKYSHYWVSTGDLVLPFAGKRVSSSKTQHIFEFLKASVEASGGVIRFGVDAVEFSNVRDFWNQSPKFSMESNYSMLVGLQSGNSNGLEGRSKYAWPHAKPFRHSDLNQSHNEVASFDETYSGRSSLSPFGDNKFDFVTSSPTEPYPKQSLRGSAALDFASSNNPSWDNLFKEEYNTSKSPQPVDAPAQTAFNQIKSQQKRLSSIQEKLSALNNTANVSCDGLDALKGTPQYLQQLKSIVTQIINKGQRDGFHGCSSQQLQSYMFFLSRYADICLHNCSGHIDKVLQALLDHRAVVV